MLDQNTDRMWYVIGAVIIGAALIFIMNSTMPQLFASVGGTFQDKVDETSAIIEDGGLNASLLDPENWEQGTTHSTGDKFEDDEYYDTHRVRFKRLIPLSSGIIKVTVDPAYTVMIGQHSGDTFLYRDIWIGSSFEYTLDDATDRVSFVVRRMDHTPIKVSDVPDIHMTVEKIR